MTQVLAPVGFGSNFGEVVALKGGGYMAVWTHLVNAIVPIPNVDDDQFQAVLGRVFNADGTPRGEVFQVNQSTAASGQSQADITVLENGNVVVAWTDGPSFTDGAVDAYARVLTPTGAAVTDEFLLSSNTDGDQRLPKVAADDRGGFAAVWFDGADPFSNTDEAIFAQRFDATGNKIGPQIYVDRQNGDEDNELLHIGDGVFTSVGEGGTTFDMDETYDWFQGILQSARTGGNGEASFNPFNFADDAITDGNGTQIAILSGAFAPSLSFWKAETRDNFQTGEFGDGTPVPDTIVTLNTSNEAITSSFIQLDFNGESRPDGVDFNPQTFQQAAVAGTFLPSGNFVVVWNAISGGTQDEPEFSLYAATVSPKGFVLSPTQVIAEDVQGGPLAPPFVAAGGGGKIFVGWTGTTDRNGEGTVELFGGVFDVPGGNVDAFIGTTDSDTIIGTVDGPGTEFDAYLLEGDDLFIEGDASFNAIVWAMEGDDTFVATSGNNTFGRFASGLGYDTLDLSRLDAGLENFFTSPTARVENNDSNQQASYEKVIGTKFADDFRLGPAIFGPFDSVDIEDEERPMIHAEDGNDTINISATSAGVIDGGRGTDVVATFLNFNDFEFSFEGDHYRLAPLYEPFGDEPPYVRPGYELELRSIERVEFADRTITLQSTPTRDSGGYEGSLTGGGGGNTGGGGGGGGNNTATGGADTLIGNGQANTINGLGGNDTIRGLGGADSLTGGRGADEIYGGGGADTIIGNQGADTVVGGNGPDLARLGAGNDVYSDTDQGGAAGVDRVFGGAGDDTISGGGGNDVLRGETGADELRGGAGADKLFGGGGGDVLYGGAGADEVTGGNGPDRAFLGQGGDKYFDNGQGGDAGRDTVFGGAGNDTIQGGGGADDFYGQAGADIINGRAGSDLILGGNGADILTGGNGNDTINAGRGADTVDLGAGNDRFVDVSQSGAFGSDTIAGGGGADRFVFAGQTGADVITDFQVGIDTIQLNSGMVGGRSASDVIDDLASVTATGVEIDLGNGNSITLSGLTTTSGLAGDLDIL
ncbi:calcium-binding protein [Pseudaestuariivita sp.]|uniref:calcium-binding protein n=1 Tax=Pseudaestuariivita sp. TaxID=2211669 RepID=UPI00405A04BA